MVKLEQNYRCSGRILRCANTLIAKNPHAHLKQLWSQHGDGENVRIWACKNNEHEAERVAAEIHYLKQAKEIPWGEFAILFRGNHQSRPLEKALQLLRIPYHLTGGTAFLDRGEVKDALAWLRVLANPGRRRGLPARDRLAQARSRRHHAGQAGADGAAGAAARCRGRPTRSSCSSS